MLSFTEKEGDNVGSGVTGKAVASGKRYVMNVRADPDA
jgi:hypothetical protein